MRRYVSPIAPITLALLVCCTRPSPTSSERAVGPTFASEDVRESDDHNDESAVLPLQRFAGSERERCQGRGYNGFDFWVGQWNASQTGATDLVGTNVITRETGGCTVEEHWTDPNGVRGRSLNAYDASTGEWNQLWMDQSGGALIFSGLSEPRSMELSGTHQTSRVDPTLLTDRATWTALGHDRVRQLGELSIAGAPFTTVYDITYKRALQPTPIAPSPLAFCSDAARPRFHAFDFLIGDWSVRSSGARRAARAIISTDLGGCLLEERMTGPDGYQSVAYSGFRSATFVWNRMSMDNRGVQLRLSGPATLTGTNMILTGRRNDRRGSSVDVRVEWALIDPSTVEQRWSFSSDGGTTWSAPEIVTMTK